MEEVKRLEEITLPDNRNSYFKIINRETGHQREYRLEDLYEEIKSLELHDAVPDDVRSQFNVARNLSLYTWFSYSFHSVSVFKAFSTLEMALRIRLGESKKGTYLKALIKDAVKRGLIKDRYFSHIKENIVDPQSTSYVEGLEDALAGLRNIDAHGSTMLGPWSVINLRICADFINRLFGKNENSP